MADALAQAEFDDPSIEREYRRWRNKLGDAFPSETSTIDAGETLYAHFLIAQYFADEGRGLGGIGPRDDGHLLHSALSRQFVEFGGIRKWSDDLQIAATTLFGLIKNHPFHDGNKRTALLSVLCLLQKQGRTASANKSKFDDFVVAIAESGGRNDDNDIEKIARDLRRMTRKLSNTRHTITYRQLNRLLQDFGFELRDARGNRIGVVRIKDGQEIYRVGFPGLSKQVAQGDLKAVRDACGLTTAEGFDSEVFFGGAETAQNLLREYALPLNKLADR